jgi:hypothetical protein
MGTTSNGHRGNSTFSALQTSESGPFLPPSVPPSPAETRESVNADLTMTVAEAFNKVLRPDDQNSSRADHTFLSVS